MTLRKCPRCELNYITDKERYCKVCLREMKGSAREEVEMCSICNEEPAMPGRDVCIFCLREMASRNTGAANHSEDTEEDDPEAAIVGSMDSVSTMDEIIPDIDDDVPRDIENDILDDPDAAFDEDDLKDAEEDDPDEDGSGDEADLM